MKSLDHTGARDAATDTRDTPAQTSPDRAAAGERGEASQPDLQAVRDIAVVPEKDAAQSKGMPVEGVPPSPSAMEHLNSRGGLRGAADTGQPEDSGNEALKARTEGVGEGATVSHLPDAGPR